MSRIITKMADCVKEVDKRVFYTTESKVHEFRGMVGGDTFDWSRRDDCCNVISMCLYIVNNDNVDILLQSLRKYLLSIERSLKNIQVNLPLWVVRLYFGSSVNAAIEKIKKIKRERPELDDKIIAEVDKIIAAYEFIISHAQVELYVIDEESLTYGIEEIRTARFAPLYDKRVNVCIVREADGTVTNLDCHNIDFFLHSSRHLFYLPNYGKINCFKTYVNDFGVDEHPYLFSGYSGWLVFYKSVLRRDFFASHQNVYDLLAGLFGTKLKLTSEFYANTFETLKNKISELEPLELEPLELEPLPDSKDVLLPLIYSKIVIPDRGTFYLSYVDFISQFKNFDFTNMLNLGFDEILLLDLFKDIISVPVLAGSSVKDILLLDRKIYVSQIPITSVTHHKLQQIKGLVIGDDILTIDFGKYDRRTSVGNVVTNLLEDTIDIPTVNKHKHIEKTSQFLFDIFNLLYFIDGLLRNINRDKPAFDIQVNYTLSDRNDVYKSSILLNTPYDPKYDRFYDFTEISSGGKRCKKYKSYKFKIKVSRKKRRLQTKKRKNRYKNTPNKR
jgi:hypothetical protein